MEMMVTLVVTKAAAQKDTEAKAKSIRRREASHKVNVFVQK